MSRTVNPFPEHKIFKFVDEETGLFWTGVLKNETRLFNETGIELRSRKAAEELFRSYEVTRVGVQRDPPLPILQMVTYEVNIVEIGRKPFSSSEKDMRLTRMNHWYGKHSHLGAFVRQLYDRKDFMEFAFVVKRKPEITNDFSAVPSVIISSRKTKKKFVAVRTEADLLYLRMMLGESFLEAYDLSTGDTVFERFDEET